MVMGTFEKIREVMCEILDCDSDEIEMETYVVRELDAESIDLLELALEVSEEFEISVKDDDLFLKHLRYYIKEAEERDKDAASHLAERIPHLEERRISHIMEDLEEGPVLKIKDLVAYVDFYLKVSS